MSDFLPACHGLGFNNVNTSVKKQSVEVTWIHGGHLLFSCFVCPGFFDIQESNIAEIVSNPSRFPV